MNKPKIKKGVEINFSLFKESIKNIAEQVLCDNEIYGDVHHAIITQLQVKCDGIKIQLPTSCYKECEIQY